MDRGFLDRLAAQTEDLKGAGLFKPERVLASPQQPVVRLADGRELINLCANNYLALANHPSIREAAHRALDRYGYGMASVRFICGTQSVHKELEARLSAFLGMDDTILYSSCFDANGGLFETLLDEQDAVISDALNHASIIDGIRLCKAQRLRYANDDLDELESRLKEASGARVKLIATDGVFSMDGVIARLHGDLRPRRPVRRARDGGRLARHRLHRPERPRHAGVSRRDGSHRHPHGHARQSTRRRSGWLHGVAQGDRRLVAAAVASVPVLEQHAPPVIAASTLRVLDLIEDGDELRANLRRNTAHFRRRMNEAGFSIVPGEHPIAPVMLGDAALAAKFAEKLLERGVYVIGFSYPVVPMGKARIRAQMTAGHSLEQLDRAIEGFIAVGRELGVIR